VGKRGPTSNGDSRFSDFIASPWYAATERASYPDPRRLG
jgi:hypothetical protein